MLRSPKRSRSAAGAVVVITGAARGMGEIYARLAADEGAAAIALWDLTPEPMEKLARELEAVGSKVRCFTVDIADRNQVAEAAERTLAELGTPDILVNNAGIVRGVPFWEHDSERDIEATMRVNTLAPMWLTRALLPAMMADRARSKRILNIASAAGTLANPNMSVYAASKWAMIGWSESLRLELERAGTGNVVVTTFVPSYVSTGMFQGARGPLLTPIMRPEAAVRAAWSGMLSGTPVVARPWTVKLAMALRGVLPTRAWDLIADRVFRVYSSMDHFVGRG
ncbi:SDR family NAD(P)-dependent oxidoreductase [Leucobacter sp. Z1108]|uniref:SDR family NAD(P)-dependent oxidoreductase n=1 Tax=Leucobacter sp. Z1108 TaxID=3439066 RepID=UPI003F32C40C